MVDEATRRSRATVGLVVGRRLVERFMEERKVRKILFLNLDYLLRRTMGWGEVEEIFEYLNFQLCILAWAEGREASAGYLPFIPEFFLLTTFSIRQKFRPGDGEN